MISTLTGGKLTALLHRVARGVFLWSALVCWASIATAAEEETRGFASYVLRSIPSKSGKVVVELHGPKDGSPNSASAVFASTGKEIFLAMPQGSDVENAAVSDDGRYIVLTYHISSGGWAEAFVRTKNARYRKFLDNDYALNQLRAGLIPGLQARDLPKEPGINMHCGLALCHSPDRLIFNFGQRFALTYSLEQRRITTWQRSLLKLWLRKSAGHLFCLSVDEFSGKRGMTLVASEILKEGGDDYETLVTFPMPKEISFLGESSPGLRRTFGKDESISLTTKKVTEAERDEKPFWEVEISGVGTRFELLREKLTMEWQSVRELDEQGLWPAPLRFLASPR